MSFCSKLVASLGLIMLMAAPSHAGETLKLGPLKSAGSFKYGISKKYSLAVRDMYPVDLDNDGNEEVIFAGFESQPNTPQLFDKTAIRIFGWSRGKLVNQTSKWLRGGIDVIEAAGDVAIGDFNGDGLKDFFTTAYSDMDHQVYEYSFINKGGYFERVQHTLGKWQHGSTVADINNDGFDDVIILGYSYSPYFLGSPTGLVRYEPFNSSHYGSDISAGHFLSPSEWSFIEVDSYAYGVNDTDTLLKRLVSFGLNEFGFELAGALPSPILGTQSHDVRAIPFKLDNDHLDDALVFSRKQGEGTSWPEESTIQLLLNKGGGEFEDVTSSKLIGFQTRTTVSYNPIVVDINNDGRLDVFISGSDWWGASNSTAILMGRPDGYLAERFRNELSRSVRNKGVVSTLVKTVSGYYLVSEYQARKAAYVKYRSIRVE